MKHLTLFLFLITSSLALQGQPEVTSTRDTNTVNVTVNTGQCYNSNLLTGVNITLTNTNAPFNTYTKVSDENGIAFFDSVAKGMYDITADKPGYKGQTYYSISVQQNYTTSFLLLRKAYPVRNLFVDPKTSMATWDVPLVIPLENTSFEGTSFPPQTSGQWSLSSDGEGWYKTSTADSMLANWLIPEWPDHYAVVNHDYSTQGGTYDFLITPGLDLRERDDFVLTFDSYFDSFYGGVATIEYSTDNGVTWSLLEQIEPDTIWKKQSVDLAALSGNNGLKNVMLAFHFIPGNGPLFDGWAVDNVEVLSNDPARVTEYHLLIYNVTDDIMLPPEETSYSFKDLVYGETYYLEMYTRNDCGMSKPVYYQWQSTYLYPPRNVRGEYVYNTDKVSLLWDLPGKEVEGTVTAYGINNSEEMYSSFKVDSTTVLTPIVGYTAGNFVNAGEFKNGSTDTMYFVDNAGMVDEVNIKNATVTSLGNCQLTDVTGMALDYSTGIYYVALWNGDLYTIDFGDLSTTLVGNSSINNLIGITFAGDSNLYGYNVGENNFYLINKENAAATVIGDIGFTAAYGQGLGYDEANDMVVMSAYNGETGKAEYRSVDLATGMSTFIGDIGPAGTQFGTIAMPVVDEPGVPEGLLSFNVYRNGNLVANVPYDNMQPPYQPEFDDFSVQPGTYIYQVSALYDLTQFGYPGQIDESCFDNEDTVVVIWGHALPFTEEWNSGNFESNYWTTDASNWVINNSTGNDAPSAEFKNMPHMTNGYESSLTSAPFRVDSLSEGSFWLDFNLKLDDLNQTGEEHLSIEVLDDNGWHQLGEVGNNGSFDFEEGFNHLELTRFIKGNTFSVRFKANGQNSTDINSWFVDNIHIYRTCDPPKNLEGEYVWKQGGDYGVNICWEAPSYPVFNSDWIYWDNGKSYTSAAICLGFSAAVRWDAGMLEEFDGDYITAVNFYTYELGYDSLVLKIWKDTNASELVYRQNVSSVLKSNSWNMIWLNTPVEIESDKEFWVGYTIYGAVSSVFTAGLDKGPAKVGYGDKFMEDGVQWDNLSDIGMSYNWNIQALVEPLSYQPDPLPLFDDDYVTCSSRSVPVQGEINLNVKDASGSFNRDLEGFNIYRSETGEEGTYVSYATVPYVAARDKYCYFDHAPNVQPQTSYWYKVSAVRSSETDGCESSFANSKLMPDEDYITVLVTQVEEPEEKEMVVYPNPAKDRLNIESSEAITQITIYDFSGKTILDQTINGDNRFTLSTGIFHGGVYMAKIRTVNSVVIKRFVIVR